MSSNTLPPLAADLDWLITMEPTQGALDDYLVGTPPAWAMPGAHNSPFSVSNVFASPATASFIQSGFDLIPNGLLADAPSERLRLYAYQHDSGAEAEIEAMRHDPRVKAEIEAMRPKGIIWGATDNLPPSYKEIKAREKNAHDTPISFLCSALLRQWEDALLVYNGEDTKYGFGTPRLCLTKPKSSTPTDKPSRPDMTLLKGLNKQGAAAHLFLLTARHELGCMYELVKAAFVGRRAERQALDTPPDGWGLNEKNILLLRARARGSQQRALGVPSYSTDFNDTTPVRRTDTPIRLFVPSSNLAELYYCFEWWYDTAHGIATNRIRCELAGCQAFVPPGRTTYCCEEHAADGRRANDAKRKQEKRQEARGTKAKQEEADRKEVQRLKRTPRGTHG